MRLRKKNERDPATQKLEKEGLLNFRKKKKKRLMFQKLIEAGRITYDFWSGVKYIIILSILIWWIPLFGPMIAGYVGGRRTGGPRRGFFAAVVSLGIVGLIHLILIEGYFFGVLDPILEYPDKLVSIAYSSSIFDPYVEFIGDYWSAFFGSVISEVPFSTNSYILTLIFAYIGGLISFERRKEYTDGVRSLKNVSSGLPSQTPTGERAASSGLSEKSLKDLKAVRCGGNGTDIDNMNLGSRNNNISKAEIEQMKNNSTQKDNKSTSDKNTSDKQDQLSDDSDLPRNEVRHHSTSKGDDWEFL